CAATAPFAGRRRRQGTGVSVALTGRRPVTSKRRCRPAGGQAISASTRLNGAGSRRHLNDLRQNSHFLLASWSIPAYHFDAHDHLNSESGPFGSALFVLGGRAGSPHGSFGPAETRVVASTPEARFIHETGLAAQLAALAEPVLNDLG